jgi:hypothetical protein
LRPVVSDISSSIKFSLIISTMAILAGIVALLFATPSIAALSGEKVACSKLRARHPDSTFFPGTEGYAYETQERRFIV